MKKARYLNSQMDLHLKSLYEVETVVDNMELGVMVQDSYRSGYTNFLYVALFVTVDRNTICHLPCYPW